MTTKIVFAHGDDWQGVYINGDLVFNDHRVFDSFRSAEQVFQHIPGVEFSEVEDESAIYDYLDEHGEFPDKLDDLLEGLKQYQEEE